MSLFYKFHYILQNILPFFATSNSVFQQLNTVVVGTHGTLTPRGSVTLPEILAQEEDLENLRESHSVPTTPRTPVETLPDYAAKLAKQSMNNVSNSPAPFEADILKLAARTVSQLFKYLL